MSDVIPLPEQGCSADDFTFGLCDRIARAEEARRYDDVTRLSARFLSLLSQRGTDTGYFVDGLLRR